MSNKLKSQFFKSFDVKKVMFNYCTHKHPVSCDINKLPDPACFMCPNLSCYQAYPKLTILQVFKLLILAYNTQFLPALIRSTQNTFLSQALRNLIKLKDNKIVYDKVQRVIYD